MAQAPPQHSAVYRTLHPPTGVTHAVAAHLRAAPAAAGALPDLAVARSTALELYAPRAGPAGDVRLELVWRAPLSGVVESLAALPRRAAGGSNADALVLALRDAKAVVLAWDAAAGELAPTSLHYFEGDEALKAGRATFARPPLALADPAGRCAAVVALRHQLAVLPAVESDAAALGIFDDGGGGGAGGHRPAAVGNSYVDNLAASAGAREVRDAAFLSGGAEPLLLLLHEAEGAGGAAARRDGCALTALSLGLARRAHPAVWRADRLPSAAQRLVPAPRGGALVLCPSLVLYYPPGGAHPSGVVLSRDALPGPPPPPIGFEAGREAPGAAAAAYARRVPPRLHPDAAPRCLRFCDTTSAADWDLDLDGAVAAWLADDAALLVLRGGQMLTLGLRPRPGGAAQLTVARAGAAPPPSAAAVLAPDLLFLGSLAGDSLLVRAARAAPAAPAAMDVDGGGGGAAAAQLRLESADADQAAPAAGGGGAPADGAAPMEGSDGEGDADADDEARIYGAADGDGGPSAAPRYALRVLDSLLNLGPVRDLAVVGAAPPGAAAGGGAAAAAAHAYAVACCGAGRGGALAVLQRRVAPEVITQVPLPGVLGAWAVAHRAEGEEAASGGGARRHDAFLLLSFAGATKVLATGEELREVVGAAGFATCEPTLAAGAVAGQRRLVQVTPAGVRLLDGVQLVQELGADALGGAAVAAADVLDPFVLVRTADGGARALTVDAASGRLAAAPALELGPGRRVAACCLHADACGWLGRQLGLGGAAAPTAYAVACFSDGGLEIVPLGVPGAPRWACASFGDGARLLDAGAAAPAGAGPAAPAVLEVRLESFDSVAAARPEFLERAGSVPACDAPVLVALTADGCMLAYKAAAGADGAGLRFVRLALDAPPLLPPASGAGPAAPRLFRFEGLGEGFPHSGLFVAGASPQWLVASRGALHAHPMALPEGLAGAAGFTPFHNVNCPHGFITACGGERGAIQISQLPPRLRLDAPWPRQKVGLGAAPLRAAVYPEAGLLALLVARQRPYAPALPEEEGGGEPRASYAYALADAVAAARGAAPRHELRLVAPGSWATLWRHALLPGERALSVAAVHLRDGSTGATVPMLAVGAGQPVGEDYPCGGRLLLFEVVRRGGGGGGGGGAAPPWGARLVFSRDFRGPVTALAAVEGYLLLATGNRLETCALSTTTVVRPAGDDVGAGGSETAFRLDRSAFHDGPMLVTALAVVKNFVLTGDCLHSCQFLRYRDEGRQLALLAKDFGRAAVRAAQFVIAGASLHVAAADGGGTLRTLAYAPGAAESWKGQRLLPWGAFHVGDRAGAAVRLRMPPPAPGDRTVRQAVLLGTDAGGLGALSPVALPEAAGAGESAALAALRALQAELARAAPQPAGLNPAAFRRRHAKIPLGLEGATCAGRPLALGEQGILDGDLLLQYAALPAGAQEQLAAAVGLPRARALALLAALVETTVLL